MEEQRIIMNSYVRVCIVKIFTIIIHLANVSCSLIRQIVYLQHHAQVEDFGKLPSGEEVHKITFGYRVWPLWLACSNGNVLVSILDFGATIQSVKVKGKDGKFEVFFKFHVIRRQEVTLNYDNLEDMLANPGLFYGATVGRQLQSYVLIIDMLTESQKASSLWMESATRCV